MACYANDGAPRRHRRLETVGPKPTGSTLRRAATIARSFSVTKVRSGRDAVRLLQLHTILLATDLSPGSCAAETTAVQLAAAAGAVLHVVHVVPDDESS